MKAVSKSLQYSHYGAIVRDSTWNGCYDSLLPLRTVKESTVQHLVDPKTNEELLIVGTSNMSTILAARTKQLLAQVKPSSILVQASNLFFDASREPATTQEQLHAQLTASGYHYLLSDMSKPPLFDIRSILFRYRKAVMSMFIHHTLRTPADWKKVFTPGLEIKYALDYAQSHNAEVVYAGEEFNEGTRMRMELEKQIDVIWPLLNYHFYLNSSWLYEAKDAGRLFQFCALKDLAENHFTKDTMAWWVRFFEKMLPNQKKAIIDLRDEDMFLMVEKKMKGPKKVAVVNQWHMEGLEKLWRMHHGISITRTPTTGTEDLPLGELQAYISGTDSDREKLEHLTHSTMASEHRQLVAYNDETRSHYG